MDLQFNIRDGRAEDGPFIARNILAAMGYDVFGKNMETVAVEAFHKLAAVCSRLDTLYSYRRARIAEVRSGRNEAEPVGSLTSYPGDEYFPLRDYTWIRFGNRGNWKETYGDDECEPGEWYLDAMAVKPEWRKHRFGIEIAGQRLTGKIGHLLMLDGIDLARWNGFPRVSLIVERAKPRLAAYYSALAFRPVRDLIFFGEPYTRMILEDKKED